MTTLSCKQCRSQQSCEPELCPQYRKETGWLLAAVKITLALAGLFVAGLMIMGGIGR